MQVINSPKIAAAAGMQPDSRGACVRVNHSAIAQNIRKIKDLLGTKTLLMAIV